MECHPAQHPKTLGYHLHQGDAIQSQQFPPTLTQKLFSSPHLVSSLPATLLSTTRGNRSIKTERGRRLKSGFARNKHQSLSSEYTVVPVQKREQLMADALEGLFSSLGKLTSREACGVVGQPTQRHASSNLLSQLRTQSNCRTQTPEEKKESSNYSQTTRTTMFKSKDTGRAAERKSCPKQSTEEILCFSQ